GKLKSLGDMYLATFYPKGLGMNLDDPMLVYPSKAYMMNKGFDKNKTGVITPRMVIERINKYYSSFKGKRINVEDNLILETPQKDNKQNHQQDNKPNTEKIAPYHHYIDTNTPINDNDYNQMLRILFANNHGPLEKIVRKTIARQYLPNNTFLIKINYNNTPDNMKNKFNDILSTALISELDAKVFLYKKADKRTANILCNVVGSIDTAFDATK